MDAFSLIVAGGLGALIVALLLLGKYYPGSGADVLDWKPTRSPELEAQNDIDDVQQMIDAQNAIRRRRGLPDRSEEEVELEVERHKRELHEYARRYEPPTRPEQGGGPEDRRGDRG